MFNIVFAMRAFLFGIAVVFGSEWPFPHQIIMIMVSSTLLLCMTLYRGSIWTDRLIHIQYTFNEIAIIWAVMFQYWFSEHIDDFKLRSAIGSWFIVLVVCTVIVNFCFVLTEVVVAIQDRLRLTKLKQDFERRKIDE